MEFTPELSQKIANAINKKSPNAQCSLCKSNKFTVLNGFAEMPMHSAFPSHPFVSKSVILLVALSCNNCSNTYFINYYGLEIV